MPREKSKVHVTFTPVTNDSVSGVCFAGHRVQCIMPDGTTHVTTIPASFKGGDLGVFMRQNPTDVITLKPKDEDMKKMSGASLKSIPKGVKDAIECQEMGLFRDHSGLRSALQVALLAPESPLVSVKKVNPGFPDAIKYIEAALNTGLRRADWGEGVFIYSVEKSRSEKGSPGKLQLVKIYSPADAAALLGSSSDVVVADDSNGSAEAEGSSELGLDSKFYGPECDVD